MTKGSMPVMVGVAGLLAASAALLAAPVAALERTDDEIIRSKISQEEEDALVGKVEARIRYALTQPQHRTSSNPVGVLPQYENFGEEDDFGYTEDYTEDSEVAESAPVTLVEVFKRAGRVMLGKSRKVKKNKKWCKMNKKTYKWKKGKCVKKNKKGRALSTTATKKKCKRGKKGKDCRKKRRTKKRSLEYINTEEVTCIARTTVREVVRTQDAEVHADAVANAFKLACEKGDNVTVADFDDVFKSKDAFAFAKTMAKVMLKCSGTSDDVYKCVTITATANAYAEATAVAHATAVSNAVNACGCLTDAVAEGMNSADQYVKLVAEAASTATAEVCITGTKLVKTRAFDSCVSSVYGLVFAEATAEAIVEGDCLSADAIAEVLAEASVDVTADSTCGMTATAFEFDPELDGPIAGPDSDAPLPETPLDTPEEEEKAATLVQALIERNPVAETPIQGPERTLEEESERTMEEESTPLVTPETPIPSEPEVAHCAGEWEQCGGEGWEGPTCCAVAGFTCLDQENNIWYSQCRNDGNTTAAV